MHRNETGQKSRRLLFVSEVKTHQLTSSKTGQAISREGVAEWHFTLKLIYSFYSPAGDMMYQQLMWLINTRKPFPYAKCEAATWAVCSSIGSQHLTVIHNTLLRQSYVPPEEFHSVYCRIRFWMWPQHIYSICFVTINNIATPPSNRLHLLHVALQLVVLVLHLLQSLDRVILQLTEDFQNRITTITSCSPTWSKSQCETLNQGCAINQLLTSVIILVSVIIKTR